MCEHCSGSNCEIVRCCVYHLVVWAVHTPATGTIVWRQVAGVAGKKAPESKSRSVESLFLRKLIESLVHVWVDSLIMYRWLNHHALYTIRDLCKPCTQGGGRRCYSLTHASCQTPASRTPFSTSTSTPKSYTPSSTTRSKVCGSPT